MKKFITHFFVAVGAISSLVTLWSLFFPTTIERSFDNYIKNLILLSIIILCFLYSLWHNKRKKSISLVINPNFNLIIEKGDLFKNSGIIAIPVNEFFDTHVGDGIISERSIHGIFINKYYKNNVAQLDMMIQNYFTTHGIIASDTVKRKYKTAKYKLGTCVDIDVREQKFILFALTHFDDNNKAYITKKEYAEVLDDLITHINSICEDKPVYISLFGTGLSRLKRSKNRILQFMVDSIDFLKDDMTIIGGLNIVINDLSGLDLGTFEEQFNYK